MLRFQLLSSTVLGRMVALTLVLMVSTAGCPPPGSPLAPSAGVREFQEIAFVNVPGGSVNVAGGNFFVRRVDLSLDTRLGAQKIGAVYNSQDGAWRWSFDVTYDGSLFADPTGARFDVESLAAGSAIPGTHWVKVSASEIRTKGGLLFVFDPQTGRLDHLRWASSSYPRLVFHEAQIAGTWHATGVDQCRSAGSCSNAYTVSYDTTGRVIAIADRAGRSTSYGYDSAGLLVQARDGLDVARGWPGFRYEYSGTLLTAITSSENERIEYDYLSRRLAEVRPIGGPNPVYQLAYAGKDDGGIFTTRITDPTGVERRYRYDDQRRLDEVELVATGETMGWSWAGVRPTSRTDPAGTTTSWTYVHDDVATETQPSGNAVTFSYAPGGADRDRPLRRPILAVQDSLGVVEQRKYDSAGRLVSIENGEGDTTSFTYDAEDMVATRTRPSGVVAALSGYGETGHAGTLQVGGVTTQRVFDSVGNRVQGPDGRSPDAGGVLSRQFDEDRNVVALEVVPHLAFAGVGPAETITVDYRSDHQRTAIHRPGGGDHQFVYDALGRLIELRERVDGAWRSTTFEYDAAGHRTATERANGMRGELAFGADGRPETMTLLRDGVPEGTATFTYANGRLVRVDDSLRPASEVYAYDAAGRPSATQYPDGELLVLGYDLRSRRIKEDFRAADLSLLRTLEYTFDGADREVGIVDDGTPILSRLYDHGQLASVSYGNGLDRSFSYDATNGELTGSSTVNGSGQTLETTTILREVNSLGLTTTATTTTTGGVDARTEEICWLTQPDDPAMPQSFAGKRVAGWGTGGTLSKAYSYDALSNMDWAGAKTFSYNAERNRLLSVTDQSVPGWPTIDYTYDEAGFVTSRGGVPLTWTAHGRLASFGTETRLQWDVRGGLISMTHLGETRRFLFGGRVVADAGGVPIALDLGEVRVPLGGGGHLYRHTDFRGNVKFTSDDQGRIVSHYRYDPYGVDAVFGADTDGVRFVNRMQVGELMILGLRIYDPLIGRFLSPDPLFHLVNQYTYALGNPVWFQDPDGTQEAGIGDTVAGIINDIIIPVLIAVAAGLVVISIVSFDLALFAIALLVVVLGIIFRWIANELTKPKGEVEIYPESQVTLVGSAGAGGGTGGGGGGDGGDAGGSGGDTSSCAPAALTRAPAAGAGWPAFLLPLQILLGLLLLRRRQQRPDPESGPVFGRSHSAGVRS
jgi:RHS repeat-associated protein